MVKHGPDIVCMYSSVVLVHELNFSFIYSFSTAVTLILVFFPNLIIVFLLKFIPI